VIGTTLGPYRIVERLGRGGMAAVYKAYQPSLDRYVAIKVLPAHLADEPGFAERFRREARAVAKLEHPHILPVHDYGQEGERTYIAMRYVEGGTLKDLLGKPLELSLIVDLVGQIAEALDYAHEHSIIHRDVKPSNVLLDRGNWALLTDFGVARMVEATQQLTGMGVGVGTPAYMSPEQGQGKKVDRRSDVYSLGVVLYEMLTGRVPFEAETPLAVVWKHVNEPLPLPRSINPEIPEAVERVVLKAMAKAPQERHQTAREFAMVLREEIHETEPVGVQPGGAGIPGAEDLYATKKARHMRLRRLLGRPHLAAIGALFVVVGAIAVARVVPALWRPSGGGGSLDLNATAKREAGPASMTTIAAATQETPPRPGTAQPLAEATFAPVQGLLFDTFDDAIYDGKFNTTIWSCGACALGDAAVGQSEGSVRLEVNAETVGLQSQTSWSFGEIGYLQGKLKLHRTDNGGVNVGFSTMLASIPWSTTCYIQSFSTSQAVYGCDVFTYINEQFRSEYVTEPFPIDYDTWHAAMIELTSDPVLLRFYLDGQPIGQHSPSDPTELEDRFLRAFFGVYTDTHLVAEIDDLLVKQAR